MFKLDSTNFEINEEESNFYIDYDNGLIQFALDISAMKGNYNEDIFSPFLVINYFETNKTTLQDLVGIEVSVLNLEDADEREDSFYIFEHEPLVKYILRIVDIKDGKCHVYFKGIVVKDGYANPYTTATLEIDCLVKIL